MPLFYPQVTHQIGGNTSGATANIATGTYVLAGGNNITLSQNANSVTISGGGGGGTTNQTGPNIGVSNLGNTAGSTGTVSTGNVVLVGSRGITLSQSTGAAGSAATITMLGNQPLSRFYPAPSFSTSGGAAANTVASIVPFFVPGPLDMSNLRLPMSVSAATQTNTSNAGVQVSVSAVLYTRNASTLSSLASASNSVSATYSSNATASIGGARAVTLDWNATTQLPPGEYWLMVHVSSATTGTGAATTSLGKTISMGVVPSVHTVLAGLNPWGAATTNTRGLLVGLGVFGTAATRGSVAFSDITGQTGTNAAAANLWFELRNWSVW